MQQSSRQNYEQSVFNLLKPHRNAKWEEDFSDFNDQDFDDGYFLCSAAPQEPFNPTHNDLNCGPKEKHEAKTNLSCARPPSDPRSYYSKSNKNETRNVQYLKKGEGLRRQENIGHDVPRREAWGTTTVSTQNERHAKIRMKPPIPQMSKQHGSDDRGADRPNFIERNKSSLQSHNEGYEKNELKKAISTRQTKPGEVPAYIEKRKAKVARQKAAVEAEERKRESDARRGCGPGEILSEDERLDILQGLRARRRLAEHEFQRFSHSTTHGPRRLAYMNTLAKEMDELDRMILKMDCPVVIVARGDPVRAW
jgi:hypothetical protein